MELTVNGCMKPGPCFLEFREEFPNVAAVETTFVNVVWLSYSMTKEVLEKNLVVADQ